jgi:predicted signal transduction protein with EAL and GGDEF domain
VVLAEGVERPVQLQRVAELGCDLYQGYLMSRPTRADSVDFNKHVSWTEGDEADAADAADAADTAAEPAEAS